RGAGRFPRAGDEAEVEGRSTCFVAPAKAVQREPGPLNGRELGSIKSRGRRPNWSSGHHLSPTNRLGWLLREHGAASNLFLAPHSLHQALQCFKPSCATYRS